MNKHRLTVGHFHENGRLMYHYHTETVKNIEHGRQRAASIIRASAEDWDFEIAPI